MKKIKFVIFFVFFHHFCLIAQTNDKATDKTNKDGTFDFSGGSAVNFDILNKYYGQMLSEKEGKSQLPNFSSISQQSTSSFPMEGIVDQDEYVIGPFDLFEIDIDGVINPKEYFINSADVLEINIWGGVSFKAPVQVSPEGTIIIPTVGEVDLKNLSLEQTKTKIINEVNKKYRSTNVAVSLKIPRQFKSIASAAFGTSFSLFVTPEGSLIIPTIGEIFVGKLTLKNAKDRIIEEIKRKYQTNNPIVTLSNLRQFNVSVTGMGDLGTYIVSPIDRVSKIVFQATKYLRIKEEEQEAKVEKEKEMKSFGAVKTSDLFQNLPYFRDEKQQKKNIFSLRKIKIFRKNGDTVSVDLMKYYSSGDLKFNPFLRDGDVVFIPPYDIEGNSIAVFGSVSNPGIFEYCEGDSIIAAFKIAQGSTDIADLKSTELTRIDKDWKKFTTVKINLSSILNGNSPNIELQRGDRIFIRNRERVFQTKEVTLRGEVNRPGKYPIFKGVTRLTEIVDFAGGFTEYAQLSEAKIIRRSDPDDELDKHPEYLRLQNLRLGKFDKYDMEYFNLEEIVKRNLIVADFKKIFIEKDKTADIILQGDEEIIVPSTMNSIYVSGQVVNPGYITCIPGMDYKYYIEKAGGFSDQAVKGDVKIVKAGSKNWVDPGDTKIEAGDIIWIPKKVVREFEYWFGLFRDIFGTVISVGTLIYLILSLKKL